MTDIVERLRRKVFRGPTMEASHTKTVEWQAADEIERLRAELNGRRTGLRVVMVAASLLDQEDLPDEPSVILCGSIEAIRNLGGLLGDRVDILPTRAALEDRSCTCHPSEAPTSCQRKYALGDCIKAALEVK